MSDLQRSFARAKLAGLPFEPPLPPNTLLEQDEEEDDDENNKKYEQFPEPSPDDDDSSASSASSTGTIRPLPSKLLFARVKGPAPSKNTLSQLPWNDFFANEIFLEKSSPTGNVTHHVYITQPTNDGPLFVTHHGAGSSGLSFAVFASEICKIIPNAGVLSLDARGHGETTVQKVDIERKEDTKPSDNALDLRLEIFSQDLVDVIELTRQKLSWTQLPDLILVGHSLGGAVITDVAATGKLGSSVLGYAVLDVVEGSAIDALQSMQNYLSTRPVSFPTLAAGIEWHTRTRTIRNSLSARVSVPSLLHKSPFTPLNTTQSYTWRTNLSATQPFWQHWFQGLSAKFLSARGAKLLILAGTDRLDKELMIGQMQGKYQLHVIPEAGHFIQEDVPAKTANMLAEFYKRNDRSAMVLPAKVGGRLGSLTDLAG